MSKYEEQAKSLKQTLGLEWGPIAVTWSDEPDERGSLDKQPSVCQVLESVKEKNVIVNFTKENLMCVGGRHFLGFEVLPLQTVAMVLTKFIHAYGSQEIAAKHLKNYPEPRAGKEKYVTVGPLEKARSDPDIAVVFCNPEQADRVGWFDSFLRLWTYDILSSMESLRIYWKCSCDW